MTTREEISGWFDKGKREGATHLIVVCDTFDHEDYPSWVHPGQDFWEKFDSYNDRNMQRIMEVYDLNAAKEPQMKETRCWRLPKRPSSSSAEPNDG